LVVEKSKRRGRVGAGQRGKDVAGEVENIWCRKDGGDWQLQIRMGKGFKRNADKENVSVRFGCQVGACAFCSGGIQDFCIMS